MRRSLYFISYLATVGAPLGHVLVSAIREAQFSCVNPDASGGGGSAADGEGSCVATAETAAASESAGGVDANAINQQPMAATPSSTIPTSKFRSERMQQFSHTVDDEATLLDLFGEATRELLTKHVIPPTDAQCTWDWRHLRCEPYCDCTLTPMYGDYSLGRACRMRYEYFEGRGTCHLPPDTPYVRAFASVAQGVQVATAKTAKLVQTVARRADVQRRVVNVRRKACASWDDRAARSDDSSMKRWQARICRGYMYDRNGEMGEDADQNNLDGEEERADAEAADIATKIASVKNGLSSVADVKDAVQSRKEMEAMGSRVEVDDESRLADEETKHAVGEEVPLETS